MAFQGFRQFAWLRNAWCSVAQKCMVLQLHPRALLRQAGVQRSGVKARHVRMQQPLVEEALFSEAGDG